MDSVKCTRCKGTGFRNCARSHLGVPGLCFHCNGDGSRETQLATKAAAKKAKIVAANETKTNAVIYSVREANGGTTRLPKDRFAWIARETKFSTQQYADQFGLSRKEAWVELCRCTWFYPHYDAEGVGDGWVWG